MSKFISLRPYVSSSTLFAFFALICLFTFDVNAQQLKVNKEKITVQAGQAFEISYSIVNADRGNFQLPNLGSNFKVVSGPSQYQSQQWINGKSSSEMRMSYQLMPLKKGKLTLGRAMYKTRKKTYQSNTVLVNVVGEMPKIPQQNQAQQSQSGQAGSLGQLNPQGQSGGGAQGLTDQNLPDIFFRIETDTSKVYMGQQVNVFYTLYSTYDLTNYNVNQAPAQQGFWVQDISADRITPRSIPYGNKVYNKYTIKKYALFPQRSGELELDPMEIEIQYRVAQQGARRGFFSRYTTQNKKLKTQDGKVSVYPLPEKGKPEGFDGAVGNFKLNVRADQTKTRVNEPINLNIGIIGNGNLKLIDALDLGVAPEEFEVYDPIVSENIYEKNNIVMGSKSFEYSLVPQKPGKLTIPPLSYSYYNPAKERYEVKNSQAIVVEVLPSNEVIVEDDKSEEMNDILGIKTGSTRFSRGGKSSVLPYFLMGGLYLLPFFAFPVLLARKRKEEEELSDVVGRKRKAALSVAQKRLDAAKALMNKKDKKGFYDETIRTIYGYLGDKMDMQTSELSKTNIQSVLSSKGVAKDKSRQLIDIIEYCEMALFAPIADADNLQKTYENTLQVIADVEETAQ